MSNSRGFASVLALLLVGAAIIGGILYVTNFSAPKLGSNFNPVQAPRTFLSGSGVGSTDVTVNLTSLKLNDGVTNITMANFGDLGFATIEPGVPKKEENISFTGVTQNANGTAALTGVTRGLLPVYPYTASTTLGVAHSGGATVILSNSGAFYSQFAISKTTTTITGNWTFGSSSLPIVTSDTTNGQVGAATNTLATVAYVNSVASSGAPNASTIVNGLVQLATSTQVASGTVSGSTGAPLVVPNSFFSATSTARVQVPVTDANGKLDAGFINQSAAYTWNGTSSFGAATNFNGSSTFTATTTFNGTTTFAGPTYGLGGRVIGKSSSTISSDSRSSNTTQTLITHVIPANTLGKDGGIHVYVPFINYSMQSNATIQVSYQYGATAGMATTTIVNTASGFNNAAGAIDIYIFNNGATNSQFGFMDFRVLSSVLTASVTSTGTGTASTDSTAAQTFTLKTINTNNNANEGFKLTGYVITSLNSN